MSSAALEIPYSLDLLVVCWGPKLVSALGDFSVYDLCGSLESSDEKITGKVRVCVDPGGKVWCSHLSPELQAAIERLAVGARAGIREMLVDSARDALSHE